MSKLKWKKNESGWYEAKTTDGFVWIAVREENRRRGWSLELLNDKDSGRIYDEMVATLAQAKETAERHDRELLERE